MAAYQELSKLGEDKRTFNCSRWVVKQLEQHSFRDLVGGEKGARLSLLDVGALDDYYKKERSWLDVTAIDLRSRHPFVREVRAETEALDCIALRCPFLSHSQTLWQIDFFDLEETLYHVICLSLVVNFVGDPARRGEMLAKAVRMLHPRGALVFVLPLACVDNSRYMTRERLHSILQQLQLSILETHATAKLYFLLAQRTDAPAPATETEVGLKGAFPKVHLRHGDKRNNFHIVF